MIKEEKIKDMLFQEQRTYYIYRTEEDRTNGLPFLTTSDEKTFLKYKEAALAGDWEVKERKND
jgi:hypothetical protein